MFRRLLARIGRRSTSAAPEIAVEQLGPPAWVNGPAFTGAQLHVCPACRGEFVYPVHYEEHDDQHWWMQLRCGECDEWQELIVDNHTAEHFDRQLDVGVAAMALSARELDDERMADEADTFIAALRADLIGPEDFDR